MDKIECSKCLKWQEKKQQLLATCESIFEAVTSLESFEIECYKSCSQVSKEQCGTQV